MDGIGNARVGKLRRDFERVLRVLERCTPVDKQLQVPAGEFVRRQQVTWQSLEVAGLDVAVRGVGEYWDDVIVPDMDDVVVENALGKFGTRVENFNRLPLNAQALVGKTGQV